MNAGFGIAEPLRGSSHPPTYDARAFTASDTEVLRTPAGYDHAEFRDEADALRLIPRLRPSRRHPGAPADGGRTRRERARRHDRAARRAGSLTAVAARAAVAAQDGLDRPSARPSQGRRRPPVVGIGSAGIVGTTAAGMIGDVNGATVNRAGGLTASNSIQTSSEPAERRTGMGGAETVAAVRPGRGAVLEGDR